MARRATAPRLPPIEQLNGLDHDPFLDALGLLFEAHGPLGERLWGSRPFSSYEQLLAVAEAVLTGLSEAQQIEVVNGHPRLGEKPEALRERSGISYQEQGYEDEEDETAHEERRLLHELCFEYEVKFGFRCVVFVNARSPRELIPVVRERMERERGEELEAAVGEVLAIARERLGPSLPTSVRHRDPESLAQIHG